VIRSLPGLSASASTARSRARFSSVVEVTWSGIFVCSSRSVTPGTAASLPGARRQAPQISNAASRAAGVPIARVRRRHEASCPASAGMAVTSTVRKLRPWMPTRLVICSPSSRIGLAPDQA